MKHDITLSPELALIACSLALSACGGSGAAAARASDAAIDAISTSTESLPDAASTDASRVLDAALPSDAGSTSTHPDSGTPQPDAGSTTSTSDAGATPPLSEDAGDCTGERDVLVWQATGVPPVRLTNLDSLWSLEMPSPFLINVTQGMGLFNGSIKVMVPGGGPPPPGVYTGTSIGYDYGDFDCNAPDGSVTVLSDTVDDAGQGAFAATFNFNCFGGTGPITGCMRFQSEPVSTDASVVPPDPGYDAGIDDTLDAGSDANDYLAPCLGHPLAYYVEGEPLAASPTMLTESQGAWTAGLNSGISTVNAGTATDGIEVEMDPTQGDSPTPLAAGTTYTVEPALGSYFSLVVNGAMCNAPTGSFTIWDYALEDPPEPTPISRLTASFLVTCSTPSGTVRGCVRYTAE